MHNCEYTKGRIRPNTGFCIAVVILIASILLLTGCSGKPGSTNSDSAGSSSISSVSESSEPVDASSDFAERYNSQHETKLVFDHTYDPKEGKSSSSSTGNYAIGSIFNYGENGTVRVNQVYEDGRMLTINALVPRDLAPEFYAGAVKALDPKVTDEAVDEAVERCVNGYGNGVLIKGSDIYNSTYFDKPENMTEIWIRMEKYQYGE